MMNPAKIGICTISVPIVKGDFKMKRFMLITVLLAVLLLCVTACTENSESRENQASTPDTTNQGEPEERMDRNDFKGEPKGDLNGGPDSASDGDRRGQGRGMSNQSSEPDEELQGILDEVQDKHPCFVLIPIFTETIVDDNFNTSPQIEVAVFVEDEGFMEKARIEIEENG